MSRNRLLIPLISMVVGCSATPFHVKRVKSETDAGENSLLYALPRAVFLVEVPVVKETRTPGACDVYLKELQSNTSKPRPNRENLHDSTDADKILAPYGLTVLELRNSPPTLSFSLVRDVTPTLTVEAEPDSDAIFAIELTSRLGLKKSLELDLSELGVLESANNSAENRAPEIAVEVVSTVVALAASVAAFADQPSQCKAHLLALDALDKRRKSIFDSLENPRPGFGISADAAKMLLEFLKPEQERLLARLTGTTKTQDKAKVVCKVTPPSTGEIMTVDVLAISVDGVWSGSENVKCTIPEGWAIDKTEVAGPAHLFSLELKRESDDAMQKYANTKAISGNKNPPTSTNPPTNPPTSTGLVYRVPARATATLVQRAARVKTVPAPPVGVPEQIGTLGISSCLDETDKPPADAQTGTGEGPPDPPKKKCLDKTSPEYSLSMATLVPQWGALRALPAGDAIKNTMAAQGMALHPRTGAPKKIKIEYGGGAVPKTSELVEKAAPLIEQLGPQKRLEKQKNELELNQKIHELLCAQAKRDGVKRAGCEANEANEAGD